MNVENPDCSEREQNPYGVTLHVFLSGESLDREEQESDDGNGREEIQQRPTRRG